MLNARKVYKEITRMPLKEREKLFAIIGRQGFEKELYSHGEVFEDIRQSPFTIKDAAEYLEVAEITIRRWVKEGALISKRIGKNIVFDIEDLRRYKRIKS